MHVIINPSAGGGRGHHMWSTIRALLPSTGVEFHATIADQSGQARDAAETATAAGADLIIAIGGDGTLNEALNGVMRGPASRRPALAFVPGGTANILARALRLPRTSAGIGHLLQHGVRRRIDVGWVNGRHFATIAAIGFDAEVVARATPLRPWMSSKPAHVAALLATLATDRPTMARVLLDGDAHVLPLTFLDAANTDWYGGGLHIAPGARADDGQFLIVYGMGLTRLETLDVMIRALSGRHLRHPKVAHRPASEVVVEGDRPLALHADGEWLGRWPSVTFRIVPASVDVIVPADRPAGIGGERRP